MNVHITGMGFGLPARRVTNDELAKTIDTTDEWIVSHTGIHARHIADENESSASLATLAAKMALERAGVKAEELGMVVMATSTPDYGAFPCSACLVQRDIGAVNAGAFDLFAACTGFIYALETARGLMLNDPRPALVIGADVMSRVTDWKDRNTCVLFGDGAGAVVLQASEQPGGLRHSILRADGKGFHSLYHEGGCRTPQTGPWMAAHLQMNGRQVFNFAVKAFEEIVRDLIARQGIALEAVRWIVPHQANVRIIEAAARRLDTGLDRFYMNIGELANTSAATVPLALEQLHREGKLNSGDTIILAGFGAGLTWGGTLVQWNPPVAGR
ncbi:MAG: beta-ketoacyl-ACP synthase III [bacterium]